MELHVTVPADLIFKAVPGKHIEIGRLEQDQRVWDQMINLSDPRTGTRRELSYEDFRRECDRWLVSTYVGDRVEGVLARHIQELADLHGTTGLYMHGGVVQEVLSVDRIQYGMIYTSEMLAEDVTDADYDDDGNLREESAQRIADKLNGEDTPNWAMPLNK
ncbi:hypothetical protein ACWEDZ_38400 [Streptomyces sp. NPDC005047]